MSSYDDVDSLPLEGPAFRAIPLFCVPSPDVDHPELHNDNQENAGRRGGGLICSSRRSGNSGCGRPAMSRLAVIPRPPSPCFIHMQLIVTSRGQHWSKLLLSLSTLLSPR